MTAQLYEVAIVAHPGTSEQMGTAYVPFPAAPCKELVISNSRPRYDTLTATGPVQEKEWHIEYQRDGGTGVGVIIPLGACVVINGIDNANQIAIRRADLRPIKTAVVAEARTPL